MNPNSGPILLCAKIIKIIDIPGKSVAFINGKHKTLEGL